MKPGDFVKYGAGLAFNTAYNYLKPNSQEPIGSQIQLYRNMKFYMKRKNASRTRTVVKKRRKGGKGMGSSGVIGPSIPYPRRAPAPSKFDLYGSRGQDENYRFTSRASINYLGFTSFKTVKATDPTLASVSGSLSYHVGAALLRFILKKEFQCEVMRHDQILNLTTTSGGTSGLSQKPSIFFVCRTQGLSTALYGPQNYTYSVPYVCDLGQGGGAGTVRFNQIAKLITANVIMSDKFGAVANTLNSTTTELCGYYIAEPDGSGTNSTTQTTAVAFVNFKQYVSLEDMYIKAYSKAEMALQNVTTADTATAGEGRYLGDRIDSNPLQCRMFKFSVPTPIVKESLPGYQLAQFVQYPNISAPTSVVNDQTGTEIPRIGFDQNGDGVFAPNDAVTYTGDFDQLPPATRFKCCTGVVNFILQPGEIRKFTLNFKYDGLLTKFIKGQTVLAANTRTVTDNSLGTSILIAAEKYMSTGASTDVALNYQLSYYTGAYCKRQKRRVLLPYDKDGNATGAVADTGGVPA